MELINELKNELRPFTLKLHEEPSKVELNRTVYIRCKDPSLRGIPVIEIRALDGLKYLDLSGNGFMDSLSDSLFENNRGLEILKLNHNKLLGMGDHLFEPCKDSLIVLHCKYNLIKSLPRSLEQCHKLKVLNVSHNLLYTLNDALFLGLKDSLRRLSLKGNEGLRSLPVSILRCRYLDYFDMSNDLEHFNFESCVNVYNYLRILADDHMGMDCCLWKKMMKARRANLLGVDKYIKEMIDDFMAIKIKKWSLTQEDYYLYYEGLDELEDDVKRWLYAVFHEDKYNKLMVNLWVSMRDVFIKLMDCVMTYPGLKEKEIWCELNKRWFLSRKYKINMLGYLINSCLIMDKYLYSWHIMEYLENSIEELFKNYKKLNGRRFETEEGFIEHFRSVLISRGCDEKKMEKLFERIQP